MMFVNIVPPMDVSSLYQLHEQESCQILGWYVFKTVDHCTQLTHIDPNKTKQTNKQTLLKAPECDCL